MFNLIQPLAHINAKFILDGKEYEIEHFKTSFFQPCDFKGQPQHEVKGGQVSVSLTHIADDNLYLWAKTSNLLKDGSIVFQTDVGMTVLRIMFEKAYCIGISRVIDSVKGSTTILTLSMEKISLNGVTHDNFWPEK